MEYGLDVARRAALEKKTRRQHQNVEADSKAAEVVSRAYGDAYLLAGGVGQRNPGTYAGRAGG